MRRVGLWPAIIYLSLGVAARLGAQQTELITDAPFTATATYNHPGQPPMVERIGRSSNGSTFIDFVNAEGVVTETIIHDLPQHRSITLTMKRRTFLIQPSQLRATTAQEWFASFSHARQSLMASTNMGTRIESGLTLYEMKFVGGSQQVDAWESIDLAIPVIYQERNAQGELIVDYNITDIRREEPDASHFIIPDGFSCGVSTGC